MNVRSIKSYPQLKYVFVAALWILSFPALIIVSTDNKLNTLYEDATNCYPMPGPPKNQTGEISYIRLSPEENHRPVYSVRFKNLHAENNNLGIFKTALHKAVKIRNLELRFYQYTSPGVTTTAVSDIPSIPEPEVATTTVSDILSVPEGATTDAVVLIKNIISNLTTPVNEWCFNIDLDNVSEILVNNFDYRVFYDDDLFFAVQSKKAMVSYKEKGVKLRGHVTIKTLDGSTLESNHVQWDVKNQYFTVNGFYVLNRDGTKTMGQNICVDAQLNNVNIKQVELKRKEPQKCFAKLQ